MPVVKHGSHYITQLGETPPHGFKNDPVLGLVENLGLHGVLLQSAKIYVGLLAATILFNATNAGVIGASRITYSMASYRHLPLFAIVGGLGTGIAWLVVVVQDAPTRYAGLAWLIAGFVFYPLYRRHLGEPLRT